jgi:hypothetical protein
MGMKTPISIAVMPLPMAGISGLSSISAKQCACHYFKDRNATAAWLGTVLAP